MDTLLSGTALADGERAASPPVVGETMTPPDAGGEPDASPSAPLGQTCQAQGAFGEKDEVKSSCPSVDNLSISALADGETAASPPVVGANMPAPITAGGEKEVNQSPTSRSKGSHPDKPSRHASFENSQSEEINANVNLSRETLPNSSTPVAAEIVNCRPFQHKKAQGGEGDVEEINTKASSRCANLSRSPSGDDKEEDIRPGNY